MRGRYEIGGIRTSSPVWLAPLAGVSGRTFREWHTALGAGLAHTEMVSAIGLSRGGAKTETLLGSADERYPLALQLFAPDDESMSAATGKALSIRPYDAIEINMACPMPKVTKRGCGADLLDDGPRAARIVKSISRIGLPIWVKIRVSGSDDRDRSFCDQMLSAGASFIFVHGRTPSQRYEGAADRGAVISLSREYAGVIGASGDVWTASDALEYMHGGCASVLAARGAIKDAFLIPAINSALGLDVDKKALSPTIYDRVDALTRIGETAVRYEGERHALVLVRRMLGGVWRNMRGAAEIRRVLASCTTWSEMSDMIENVRKDVVIWQNEI